MNQLIRYLIVAVAAYVIDMGGYIILLKFDVSPVLANIFVKIGAAIFGFFAHRWFTYQIKNTINMMPHAIKYFSLVSVYTPVSSIALAAAMFVIPHPVIAKFICDVILFVVVYWITSKFTFLQDKSEQTST